MTSPTSAYFTDNESVSVNFIVADEVDHKDTDKEEPNKTVTSETIETAIQSGNGKMQEEIANHLKHGSE